MLTRNRTPLIMPPNTLETRIRVSDDRRTTRPIQERTNTRKIDFGGGTSLRIKDSPKSRLHLQVNVSEKRTQLSRGFGRLPEELYIILTNKPV
jgi:hypothetical protein